MSPPSSGRPTSSGKSAGISAGAVGSVGSVGSGVPDGSVVGVDDGGADGAERRRVTAWWATRRVAASVGGLGRGIGRGLGRGLGRGWRGRRDLAEHRQSLDRAPQRPDGRVDGVPGALAGPLPVRRRDEEGGADGHHVHDGRTRARLAVEAVGLQERGGRPGTERRRQHLGPGLHVAAGVGLGAVVDEAGQAVGEAARVVGSPEDQQLTGVGGLAAAVVGHHPVTGAQSAQRGSAAQLEVTQAGAAPGGRDGVGGTAHARGQREVVGDRGARARPVARRRDGAVRRATRRRSARRLVAAPGGEREGAGQRGGDEPCAVPHDR